MVAIDVCCWLDVDNFGWDVYVWGGWENIGLDAIVWVEEVVKWGVGELLVISMDGDGI